MDELTKSEYCKVCNLMVVQDEDGDWIHLDQRHQCDVVPEYGKATPGGKRRRPQRHRRISTRYPKLMSKMFDILPVNVISVGDGPMDLRINNFNAFSLKAWKSAYRLPVYVGDTVSYIIDGARISPSKTIVHYPDNEVAFSIKDNGRFDLERSASEDWNKLGPKFIPAWGMLHQYSVTSVLQVCRLSDLKNQQVSFGAQDVELLFDKIHCGWAMGKQESRVRYLSSKYKLKGYLNDAVVQNLNDSEIINLTHRLKMPVCDRIHIKDGVPYLTYINPYVAVYSLKPI